MARTIASVSPWSVRRSEWPTMTWVAPASFSISAEMSPVWAPLCLGVAVLAARTHRRAGEHLGGARQERRRHADQRLGLGVEPAQEAVTDGAQFGELLRRCRSSSSCRPRAGEFRGS